ncbi:hypothetical protein [uncultured Sphaerotilus sp.]|uniref:hypothetical protein n=1 Tax=uncultured Sphaerotilus sp. TaxID=474984 RepID=UPI0030CA59D2
MKNAHPVPKDKAGAPGKGAAILAEEQADLFGAAPEAPRTLPAPGTQARRVLALLATGETPDHADWYALSGSWRLAAHVDDLRKLHGWPVQTRDVLAATEAHPGRTIARYWLPADDVMRARVALRAGGAS